MKLTLIALALVTFACGCNSAPPARTDLSAGLENQMNRYIRRVQVGRADTLRPDLAVLSAFGKHAVIPVKEDLLGSENPRVRSNAVYVLGEIYRLDGDPLALQAIEGMMDDSDQSVRLEVARAMMEAGDYRGMEMLVSGLSSSERLVRLASFQTLGRVAGTTFGYNPDADLAARAGATARFQEWASRSF